jgi:hypothetical protein
MTISTEDHEAVQAKTDTRRIDALGRQCLAALCYFDLFRYPLTAEEVRRFRYASDGEAAEAGAGEVIEALSSLPVECRDGYWFLAGRAADVDERQRRFRLAEPKFRRARFAARLLGLLPSVRLVAVCNSMGLVNAHERSDIDLFLVVRPKTIWATRLVVVGLLAALGLRPTGRVKADRLCLNFFVTEDSLRLQRFANGPDDAHFRYWLASFVPVYDAGGVFESFMAANRWIADRLPGFVPPQSGHRRSVAIPEAHFLFWPLLLLERSARFLQMHIFPSAILDVANRSTEVVVSDSVLKFHVNDPRLRLEAEFREKLKEYGLL